MLPGRATSGADRLVAVGAAPTAISVPAIRQSLAAGMRRPSRDAWMFGDSGCRMSRGGSPTSPTNPSLFGRFEVADCEKRVRAGPAPMGRPPPAVQCSAAVRGCRGP